MERAILKTGAGLVQIVRCPKCLYMVSEALDIVWRRQPVDMQDQGEIECCRFCEAGRVEVYVQGKRLLPSEFNVTADGIVTISAARP
jgi:hypothetical protein